MRSVRLLDMLTKAFSPVATWALLSMVIVAFSACSLDSSIKKIGGDNAVESVIFKTLNPSVVEGTTTVSLLVEKPLSKKQKLKFKLLDSANAQILEGERDLEAGALSFLLPGLPLPADNAIDEFNWTYHLIIVDERGETNELNLTVLDNDDPPTIAIDDATATEGSVVAHAVSLSVVSGKDVVFTYQTLSTGTATAGTDFTALAATTVTIPAGATGFTINVTSSADALDESDETVQVRLSLVTNATIADNEATGTILDDDAAPAVAFAVASQSVTEATGGVVVTVTAQLTAASGRDVTVPYTVTGTASTTTDHNAANGTLTISAGSLTGSATFLVIDDSADEPTETAVFTMGTPVQATAGAPAVHTVTINDDDGSPTLSIGNATITEGGNATFSVTLSAPSGQTVTFDAATSDGTATTADSDYTNLSQTGLTIAAGQTSATFTVATGNDSKDEPDETFTVTISNVQNADNGSLTGIGTITDNDAAPTVQFSVALQNTGGVESGTLTIQVNLSAASGKQVIVPLTISGTSTAADPADYSLSATSVTINAGSTSGSVNLVVASDTLDESNETVVVDLGAPVNATASGTSTQTITIDDDDALPSISIAASTATEASPITFTITQSAVSGRNVTFTFNANSGGTASSGADYTAVSNLILTITAGQTSVMTAVATASDLIDETNETFDAVISGAVNATVGTGSVAGTINDDDGTPTISIADASIAEGSNLVFTVTLSAASGQDVRFDWATADNTATTADSDYTGASGNDITITAGSTSVTLTIATGNDSKDEVDETISVALSDLQNIGAGTTSATGTITDNDAEPSVQFSIGAQNTGGSESGTLTIIVVTSAASGKQIIVPLTVNGSSTASSPADYSLTATTVTIPAGSTSGSIDLTVVGDTLDEANETVVVDIGTPTNATAAGTTSQTVTIDDDDATPSLAIAASIATEAGTLTFTITQSAVSGREVTFTFNANSGGDAAAGTDYMSVTNRMLTIPAGQTSVTTTVVSLTDVLDEVNETFDAVISGPTNASIGTGTGVGTITDDDGAPTLNISATSATEGSNLVFTVSLTSASGTNVTFDWATSDNTATTADSDYTAGSGNDVTLTAGQTSVTLTISTGNDTKDEVDETVTVTLSDVQNAASGTLSADGTIQDNDAEPTVQFSTANQNSGGVESGNITVQVNLSAVSGKQVVVPLTIVGTSTAANSADYTLSANSVTIAAGGSNGSVTLTIATDALDEADETLVLDLGTPTNATVSGTSTQTVTINDDDATPSLSIAAASATEASSVVFTITLSAAAGRDVTFTFNANSGGSAVAGTDYSGVTNAVLTISAGATSVTATVATTSDAVNEANETFTAAISGPTNATLGTSSVSGTINDDDSVPTISIAAASATEASSIVFTITQSAVSGQDVTFTFNANSGGTAAAGADYTGVTNQVLTITAGQTAVTTAVATLSDTTDEVNETFTAAISGPTNATLGTSSVSGTIDDDDNGPSISIAASSATEASGIVFTISASAVSGQDISFTFNANSGGTAAAGTDYTGVTNLVLTISAGSSNVTTTVTTLTDALDEADETFTAAISGPANATLGTSSVSGTINDDDAQPSISIAASGATEASDIVFTVTQSAASGRDVTFTFNANAGGNATAGTDYTSVTNQILTITAGQTAATTTVTTLTDALNEPNETFTAAISGAVNASLGTTSVSGTITDDDAQPTISIADTSVTEGATLIFTVTLSTASGQAITFDWTTADGTATSAESDYSPRSGNNVSIAAGVTSMTLTVPTGGDSLDEANETISVALSDLQNVAAGTTSATGTINDNDIHPSIQFTAASQNTGGVESGNVVVTLTITAVSGLTITAPITVNGSSTAANPADYSISANSVTIQPGSTSVSLTITVAGDTRDELNETVILNLGSATNALAGATTTQTVTIDDDDAQPSLSIAAANATEASAITFTITQDAISNLNVTFTFNANSGGDATAGTDYTGVTNRLLTIAAGQTSVTTTVSTTSDVIDEANETFTAAISGATNATLGTASVSGTINDDDGAPTLNISDATGTEGGNVVFTVSLTAASGQAVTFDWTTGDGTATTADSDYTTNSGTGVSIGAGQTSVTLTIATGNDTKDEVDETFDITVSNVQLATAGDLTGVGTITDNDAAPTVQFSVASQNTSGAESGTKTVQVNLSAVSGKQVVVPLTVNGSSTAVDPADYTLSATSVTIAAGSSNGSITLTVATDALDEDNETVVLDIGTPSSATASGTVSQTVTIDDDDATPSIWIAANSATEASNIVFTITVSAVSGRAITLTFNANSGGTATAGTDYTAVNGQVLTISAGVSNITTTVSTLTDTLDEANETFTAAISGPTNATLGTASVSGTINDDDAQPSISIAASSATEASGIVFTITPSAVSGQDIVLTFNANSGGTALAGTDYTSVTNLVLTISAGASNVTTTVTTLTDALDEANETFTAAISGPTNATLGTSSVSGTINDDDATPSLWLAFSSDATEASDIVVTTTISAVSGRNVTFTFNANAGGDASPGVDYTGVTNRLLTITAGDFGVSTTITTLADSLDENDEMFVTSISGATNATISIGAGLGIVNDDDALPSISIGDSAATEAGNVVLTVTLSPVSGRNLTFDWATSDGTATSGTDYTSFATTTATIYAGSTTTTLTIATLSDALDEPNETFNLDLSNPVFVTISDNVGIATINDDDSTPTISVAAATANEGASAAFAISLSAASGQQVTVAYATSNGTAVQPGDYTSASGTATIAAGSTSTTVSVALADDSLEETDETLTITLSSPNNATLGTASATGTIRDAVLYFDFMTGSLPSGLTFARTSTATYFDSNGVMQTAAANTPRFDYDPATRQLRGLLIEMPMTNEVRYSADLTQGWVTFQSVVQSNVTTAPDGTSTADKIRLDNNSSTHFIRQDITTLADNTLYTFSMFLKKAEADWVYIYVRDKAGVTHRMYVDMASGKLGTLEPGVLQARLVPIGSGWYRASFAVDSSAGATTPRVAVGIAGGDNIGGFVGDNTSGLYVWGAQLEEKTVASSYIASGSSLGTRAQDSLTADSFATWYNSGAWTAVFDFSRNQYETTLEDEYVWLYSFHNTASLMQDRIYSVYSSQYINFGIGAFLGGAGQGASDGVATAKHSHGLYQVASIKSANSLQIVENGSARTGATLSAVPTVNELTIGGAGAANYWIQMRGHARKFTYRPRALSAAQVQTLTSDDPVQVSLTEIARTVPERAGTLLLTARLNRVSTSAVTAPITFTGTATGGGTDYSVSATTITIPAGSLEASATITLNSESAYESDETILATIGTPTNATAVSPTVETITIENDDVVSLSIADNAATEGGNIVLTVTLAQASASPVTFTWATSDGTASSASSDYTAVSATNVTIAAGTTTATLTVASLQDTLDEADETITVTLTNPGNVTFADNVGIATINDNDSAPTISIASATGNEGGSLVFTVSLNAASGQNATFNYASSSGSATSGTDFTAVSGTGTITAGATTTLINVAATDDTTDESDETMTMTISSPSNATLGTASATGTVRDATLFFDFTTGTLPSGLTYTRSGTATYFDSNGLLQTASANTPRYDYDPASGQLRGLLIEKNRTNSITYSEQFDHANWTKTASLVTANSSGTTAPDGTQTADFVFETTANSGHYVRQTVNAVNSSNFTYSVFAKSPPIGGRPYIIISIQSSTNNVIGRFNLAKGVVSSTSTGGTGANVVASIQPIKNGWYRLRVSGQFSSGVTNPMVYNGLLATDGGSSTYTGNGSSGAWFWGSQFEIGTSVPSSYIATTSAADNRASDFLVVDSFATWYNATDWTSILDFSRPNYEHSSQDNYWMLFHFGDPGSSYADRIYTVYGTAAKRFTINAFTGSVSQGGSLGATQTYLGDAVYQVGGIKSGNTLRNIENGTASTVSGTLSLGTMTELALGNYGSINQAGLTGHLRKFTYRPRALSAASAQTLTNDDPVRVSFREISKLVPESEPTVLLTATLDRVSASQVTVPFALTGTATGGGTDYSVSSSTITIAAGALEGSVTVTIAAEATFEPDETIIATMGTPTNATALAPTVETITLQNDDFTLPVVSVGVSDTVQGVINKAELTSDTGFAYMLPNTENFGTPADSGVWGDISILKIFENGVELGSAHASHVDIRNLGLGRFSHWDASADGNQSLRFSASDNTDPRTNGRAYMYQFTSSAIGNEGGVVRFAITLDTPAPQNVTVAYASSSGTATSGSDFTATSGTVTITAGRTLAVVTVPALEDGVDEGDETVLMVLSSPVNATLGTATITGTIRDAVLNMDFLAGSLPSGLTFNRASNATYFDSSGVMQTATINVPRFDYDPANGQLRGLLMEREVTNLAVYSQAFDNGVWEKNGVSITANSTGTTAPDGTQTADFVQENSSNMAHYVNQLVANVSNSNFTYTVYAKSPPVGGRPSVQINIGNATSTNMVSAFFNIGRGSLGSTSTVGTGANVVSSIQPLSNGWYRLRVSGRLTSGVTNVNFYTNLLASDGASTNYLGNGAGGIWLWGAQVELNSIPTSYVPTVAATATRSADILLANNFATWFNAAAWTSILDYSRPYYEDTSQTARNSTYMMTFGQTSNGYADSIATAYDTENKILYSRAAVNWVAQGSSDDSVRTFVSNSVNQVGLIKSGSTIQQIQNGAALTATGAITIPTVNELAIASWGPAGMASWGGSCCSLNGHVRKFTYRARAMSAANTQTITNDEAVRVSFKEATKLVPESAATVQLTAALNRISTSQVTVPVTFTGTATGGGTDYSLSATTITVAIGALEGSVTATIAADSLYEDSETIIATMGSPTNATTLTPSVSTFTILDDDTAPSLSINDPTVSSEGGNANFVVSLSAASWQNVTFSYVTANGTATQPGDYTSATGTGTITAGATSTTIAVATVDDATNEGAETFSMTISSASAGAITDNAGVATIAANDFPAVFSFDFRSELPPEATFTRSSTGTYFDSTGKLVTATANSPRFDHDPATGRPAGLLLEESRQNLFLHSQNFTSAAWSSAPYDTTMSATSVLAPDRTSTAYRMTEGSAGTIRHVLLQNVTLQNSKAYTVSVFFKKIDRGIAMGGQNNSATQWPGCSWDDTVTESGCWEGATQSTQVLVDGWYRLSVTFDSGTGAVPPYVYFQLVNETIDTLYAGNGVSGALLWGAQLEQGYFATSYMSTGAATATRTADLAVVSDTTWLNQTDFSSFSQIDRVGYEPTTATAVYPYAWSFYNDANTDRIYLIYASDTQIYSFGAWSANVSRGGVALGATAYTPYQAHGFATTKSVLNLTISKNGAAPVSGTLSAQPATERLSFGSKNGSGTFNGHVRLAKFWSSALTSAQQQFVSSQFNILGVTGGTDVTADARLTVAGISPTISWQNIAGETGYTILLYDAAGTTVLCGPALAAADVTTTNFSNGCPLTAGTSYRVEVFARTADANVRNYAANAMYRFNVAQTVNFSSASSTVSEATSATTITASLNAANDVDVYVPVTFTGTATERSDYYKQNPIIRIAAGSTSGSLVFNMINDTIMETNETIILTMGTPTNAVVGATGTHTVTLTSDDVPTVTKVYTNKGNWGDYVQYDNDAGGTNPYNQDEEDCLGTEVGYYEKCIHGGERRKVVVTGEASCSNLTITDSLGAWKWKCMVTGGTATFYTMGLATGKGLGDLINATSWKSNTVTVQKSGSSMGTSASAVWDWTNAVVALPNNSSGSLIKLDTVDDDGAGPDLAYAAGSIFTLASSRTTPGYNINMDRASLVVLPGATLTYNGSATRNCSYYNVDSGTDTYCIVGAHSQKFIWVEGWIFGDNTTADLFGVALSTVNFSRVHNLRGKGTSNEALIIFNSDSNLVTNVRADENSGHSHIVSLDQTDYNRVQGVTIGKLLTTSPAGTQGGFSMWSGTNNIFHDIKFSHMPAPYDPAPKWNGRLVEVNGTDNTLTRIMGTGAADTGVILYTGHRNTLSHLFLANNGNSALYISDANYVTVNQLVAVNNGPDYQIAMDSSTQTKLSQVVAVGPSTYSFVSIATSNNNSFTNNILTGGAAQPCYDDGGQASPGIPVGTGGACSNQGASNATWTSGVSVAASFLGKVTANDTTNAYDTNGTGTYASILNFIDFDSPYRAWGKEHADAFPSLNHVGPCMSGTCRIWDWRLEDTVSVIRNTSNNGSTANNAFVAGATCPAAVHGNKAITDQKTAPNTFLINAEEIMTDEIGDDDGLCESNEACIYSPNFGLYQGEGDYTAAGTCTFTNGTVTGVQMYAYPTNGN